MKFMVKKISTLIITLLMVSLLTFIVFQIIPGDQAATRLGIDATQEAIENLRVEMGLNKPIVERYVSWILKGIKGDFGISYQYNMPVKELIKQRLPVTITLSIISLLLIVIISIPVGIIAAKEEDKLIDHVIRIITQICMAIPSFFLGIMITLLFGLLLKWFTPGDYVSASENFAQFIYYMIFPAIAIAIPKIAMLVKFLRSSVIRQLELDYVRTAYSKGNKVNRVLYKHVLKNGLIPVITFMAMIITDVLAGSIIVEQVFNLPGLGRLLVVSISYRDFPTVSAIVLYIASIVIITNFLVDLVYQYVDPRIRIS